MKKILKRFIRKLPGGEAGISAIKRYREQRFLQSFKTKEELFSHYYHHNRWGSEESLSGAGSTLEYTENIRAELPGLIKSLGIKSILDAPCGDYNWFRLVERGDDVNYIGGDIVPALIARNNERFANSNTKFMVLDITKDPLPEVDLWLCRDCLFHLPNADIHRALDRFRESNIRYLLTSKHPECEKNLDVLAGGFRLVDLQLPPFNLREPSLLIKDWIPSYPVRYLALWERSALD